jgi:DNA invertase Pin-like site-specific DNA recombinase
MKAGTQGNGSAPRPRSALATRRGELDASRTPAPDASHTAAGDASRPVAWLYHRQSIGDPGAEVLEELARVAELRGYRVGRRVGESGARDRNARPGLREVRAGANRGEFSALFVRDVDRFGGTAIQCFANIDRLHECGVRFVAVNDGLDLPPDPDPIQEQAFIGAAIGQRFEILKIRQRTREGLRRARARGVRLGRPPVEWDKIEAFRLRHTEKKSIRAIAELVGVSPATVCRELSRAEAALA